MKNAKNRFYKSRKFLITFLAILISVGLIILFFSRILITFPFKDSFVQISINHGFNAFFPRDKTSLFYFHNSLRPQIITDANTSYEGKQGLPYFQIYLPFTLPKPQYNLPNFTVQIPTSNTFNLPKTEIPIPKSDSVTSQIGKLTFKLPPDFYLEYHPPTEANHNSMETININNGPTGLKDNWMSLQFNNYENCQVTATPHPQINSKNITVAGKWQMLIIKSHGRYGSREHKGKICLDNNITLHMDRYVKEDGNQAEMDYDKILETAVYRP